MRTEPYPSDLTDAQWAVLEPLVPPAHELGRPRKTDLREVLNAIFYRNGTDQENGAVPDHLVSATRDVSVWASHSEAHFSSRFVLCLVPARAIDWQASVSFAF